MPDPLPASRPQPRPPTRQRGPGWLCHPGRVSEIEQIRAEVAELRSDSAHTRTLAAMADRDAADVRVVLRAHTQSLGALRQTQVEQDTTLRGIAEAVGALAAGQSRHEQLLQAVAAGQQRHDQVLEQLAGAVTGLAAGQARHEQAVTDIATTVHHIAGDA